MNYFTVSHFLPLNTKRMEKKKHINKINTKFGNLRFEV
jgi:hypothetical protein